MSERNELPEIEPLPERRWAQIERDVLERVGELEPAAAVSVRPRGRWNVGQMALTVAVSAAVAATVVWALPTLTGRQPDVSHVATSGSPARTNAGDATIELAARSSVLVVPRERDGWLVVLERGRARFTVPPRRARPPFVVEAGETRVEVIGTCFTVTRAAGAGRADVEVEHGVVRVWNDGAVEVLHAGEHSSRVARTAVVAVPRVASSTTPPPETAPPVAVAAAARAALPAPHHVAAVTTRTAESLGVTAAPAVQDDAVPSVPAPEAAANPSRDRYVEAEGLEARDPTRALQLYAGVAANGGSWGALALFAQARLELELHHGTRGRDLLQAYLARYPAGLNAEDARRLLHDLP